MTWCGFATQVPGKWVLAGEHAVLRGAPAVTLPHPEYKLSLSFAPGDSGQLQIEPESAASVVPELLRLIEESRPRSTLEDISVGRPLGKLRVESSIPLGAGLGSSAALCVALTRWLSEPLRMSPEDHFEFATRLEDHFHGRSSGMDVAAILAGEPVSYVRGQGAKSLGVKRLPKFSFHDTGLRARTSDCVRKLETFRSAEPALGARTDEWMGEASRLAVEGLIIFDRGRTEEGLQLLAQSMKRAQDCYYAWDLVPEPARRLEQELRMQGALGVKLTGAGDGGMLVALWEGL